MECIDQPTKTNPMFVIWLCLIFYPWVALVLWSGWILSTDLFRVFGTSNVNFWMECVKERMLGCEQIVMFTQSFTEVLGFPSLMVLPNLVCWGFIIWINTMPKERIND